MKILITKKQLNLIKEDYQGGEFNPQIFASLVLNKGISHPDVAIAQSILETGWYKSDIFNVNNNLFGMKFPKKRKTVAVGENMGHAKYEKWEDSVNDYKLWQDYYNQLRKSKKLNPIDSMSKDEYYSFLDSIYCPLNQCKAGKYSNSLKTLISKAQEFINDSKKVDQPNQ